MGGREPVAQRAEGDLLGFDQGRGKRERAGLAWAGNRRWAWPGGRDGLSPRKEAKSNSNLARRFENGGEKLQTANLNFKCYEHYI